MERTHDDILDELIELKRKSRRFYFQIEGVSRGAIYCDDHPTLYAYGVYGRESVLCGTERRIFIEHFENETKAQQFIAYAKNKRINVDYIPGSCYNPPSLNHLPGPNDLD